MMRKTIDKAKEIIENIKRLDAESEPESSKAALNLEKYGAHFLSVFLENYESFTHAQAGRAMKIALALALDPSSKKDSKYYDEILQKLVIRYSNEKNNQNLTVWLSLIGKIGNLHAIPIIARSLMSADKRVRANTVEALGKIGGAQVKELLLPYLNDSNNRVKANTAIALWEFDELRAKIKKVFDKMVNDPNKWMKASAFYAFGEIKAGEFLQILVDSLEDNDEDICRNAFLALVGYAEKYSDLGTVIPPLETGKKARK